MRQGLLGGTLSAAWPLLHLAEKNPKLEYGGLKKIDGRQLHELRHSPRKGGDIKISLYFDAETFQHVRTEYNKTIAGQIATGGVDASKESSGETRYQMVEEFGSFKKEGAFTLPHDYKLTFKLQTPTQNIIFEWTAKLETFTFDWAIQDSEFYIAA